jgi:hypothetical protein
MVAKRRHGHDHAGHRDAARPHGLTRTPSTNALRGQRGDDYNDNRTEHFYNRNKTGLILVQSGQP